MVAAACSSSSDNTSAGSNGDGGGAMAAVVASYDLVAGRTGRFIVGLFGSDRTQTVAFGAVSLTFAPVDGDSTPSDPVQATFLPIPGQDLDPDQTGPRLVGPAEATGVYGANGVAFDQPGFWEVAVTATLDGRTETATAAFEVLESSALPAVGDPAPRTTQPLVGDPAVEAKAVDSRATTDRPVPDPQLHDTTIADALDAGQPVLVVVSTPTFCVSRFCGPITESVEALAAEFAHTDMAFVHLEVWQDFENNVVNPAAREWIAPTPGSDGGEPWVFIVNRAGTITHRFDNVATDAAMRAAVEDVLEP
jgi:hypothetical protein